MRYIFILIFLLGLYPLTGWAQNRMITGKVVDKINKEPLVGVSVAVKNSENRVLYGTATNLDGEFALKVLDEKLKLEFTYIGYKSQTFAIGTRTRFDVNLEELSTAIDEVVVTAKSMSNVSGMNIPTREVSGAVQTISMKDMEGLQVSSVDDALQGRIAGLDIVANSGAPGAGMSMRIRGTSSLNASQNPLVVVNGIPYDTEINSGFDFANADENEYASLISVSPDDIESISVLKDAASTAIWGAKAANGVLMITTKKASKGKTNVSYSYRLTRSNMGKTPKLLNGDDYTMMIQESFFNNNTNNDLTLSKEFMYDPGFSEYQQYNNNTDWVDAISRTGLTHDHSLAISGGGERATFRVSAGWLSQDGTILGQHLNRFTNRISLLYQVSDRIQFSTEFAYTLSDNDKLYNQDLLNVAMRKMPNLTIYKQDREGYNTGEYYYILNSSAIDNEQKNLGNPVAEARLAKNNERNNRINPTFRLQYDLMNPERGLLRYAGYVSFDINNVKTTSFYPKELKTGTWDNENMNKSYEYESENITVRTENKVMWAPRLGEDHSFSAYFAIQTSSATSSENKLTTYGHPGSAYQNGNSEAYIQNQSSSVGKGRSTGMLLSLHYAYKGRYIVDFIGRRDGNSRFGQDRRFGNFPAVALRYNLTDENFMEGIRKYMNMFAIRASWGLSGNVPKKDGLYFSKYAAYDNGYGNMAAVRPNNVQVSNLRWEKTASWNLGLTVGLWDDRVIIEPELYHKHTTDLLIEGLKIPTTSGYGSLEWQNVGAMDNDGWELNIRTNRLISAGHFSADFSVNLANNRNQYKELSPLMVREEGNALANGSYKTIKQINNPLGSFYGYRNKGVFQYSEYIPGVQENAPVARDANGNVLLDVNGNPKKLYFAYGNRNYVFTGGDAIYEDINHDGSIDERDVVYLGTVQPKLVGGFGTTLRYGKLTLSAFFNFRSGNKVINQTRMDLEKMTGYGNQSVAVNWRWRKEGDVTQMPRAVFDGSKMYNYLGSDRFVEDGSFLRFKSLSLQYDCPSRWLNRYGLTSLKAFCTMQNLACWTKYSGCDPEVGLDGNSAGYDKSKTPRSKEVLFGLTIGF